MKLIKENEKGITYQAEKCKILYRKKGTTAGDNDINAYERVYLITGSAKITLKDVVQEVHAPAEFEFPEKTYHKIEALTDIAFLVFDE